MQLVRTLVASLALSHLGASGAMAQAHYRNLDAGQPGRIEDAEVAPRYSLGVVLSPLQFERLAGGSWRYRAEPKISYGVLPLTELEVRVPMVELVPPSSTGVGSTSGIAGVSVGLTRALTIETADAPAFALTGELSLPVGALAGSQASFLLKGLMTKTVGSFRYHANAGGGTYSVGRPRRGSGCGERLVVAGDTTCGAGPIIIFDVPCNRAPVAPPIAASATRMCMRAPTDSVVQLASTGKRWSVAAGVDHSFPLRSTLISADVFADRFIGLYRNVDLTAELGIRHQLTPIIVINAGVGRHFAGTILSTFVIAGASFELAVPPWF